MTRTGAARGSLLFGALFFSCGGEASSGDGGIDAGSSCPNDLPMSCVMPAPSYATTIAPLLQLRCLGCHSPGNVEASKPLDSYNGVYSLRGTVLTQVYGCQMPPPGVPTLDAGERHELLSWLVCQAPNN